MTRVEESGKRELAYFIDKSPVLTCVGKSGIHASTGGRMKVRAAVLATSMLIGFGGVVATAGAAEAHSGCYINYDSVEAWASCESYNGREKMRVKLVCANSSGSDSRTVYGDWVAYAGDNSYAACPSGFGNLVEPYMQFSVG